MYSNGNSFGTNPATGAPELPPCAASLLVKLLSTEPLQDSRAL